MVAAGFPCIDVSRAGLRAGMEGESTSLMRHVFRLLHTAKNNNRPVRWVLLENVEAVLDRHGDKPPVIAYIAKQFMDLGYCSWAYRTVISAGFGLPNRRKRVFIVAAMDGDARDVLLSQGTRACAGACKEIFDGNACYTCHLDDLEKKENDDDVSYAIDLGNAMYVYHYLFFFFNLFIIYFITIYFNIIIGVLLARTLCPRSPLQTIECCSSSPMDTVACSVSKMQNDFKVFLRGGQGLVIPLPHQVFQLIERQEPKTWTPPLMHRIDGTCWGMR